MRRTSSAPVVAISALCLWLAIGLFSLASARSLQEIKTTGEIRFCLAGSGQELYRRNAMALAAFLGKDIHVSFIHFDKWDDQFVNSQGVVIQDGEYTPEPLASGKCDLYPNDLVETGWRKKKMAFVPLFISRNTIIVSEKDRNQYTDISALAGKRAAVMRGTSFHTWLESQNRGIFKNNPITFDYMPQKEAILAVQAGKADFAITGADGALWAVNNFAPHAHVAFPVGKTTTYGWCFRKKDKALQEAVRRFFDKERQSPDSAINRNWKDYIGLTLGEFTLFVTSTPEPANN